MEVHEFFAVTITSVYRVSDQKDKDVPIIEKIALRGESKIPIGGRLKNGSLVGLARTGIELYDEDHPKLGRRQRPEEVNTGFIGGHTSPIVGLFFKKEEALTCSVSENLQIYDPRWQKQTQEVLNAIGDNHPIFIIARWEKMSFA
ncbi:MAG: hypothetical protein V1739_07090 [Candidatus Omnitrophota bacterium]